MAAPSPGPGRFPAFLARYAATDFRADAAAGVTLAAITIPEQMATARLGGFAPEAGFLAFVAATVAFAVVGRNRVLSVGADSTITPIFAGGLTAWAAFGSPHYAALAAALALLVGVLLIGAGALRLGWVADLMSVPVTLGALGGIAVHIAAAQLPDLLGIAAPTGPLLTRLAAIAAALGHANGYTVALGVGVLLVTLLCERISARLPGALLGLVAATLAVALFHLERHGVAVLSVESGAVSLAGWPAVSSAEVVRMVPLALVVTVVVMLQSAATSRAFPAGPGAPPSVNRDFAGIGAGCLLAGLAGAFPVNASPPRTAIVAETGGRTRGAGVVAAAVVLALALFGARLAAHVPVAALAGLLLFVAARIFRLPRMVDVYRRTFQEFLLIVVTMAAIVVLPIESGVGIGIMLSVLHGMWTTTRAFPIEFEQVPGTSIWWAPSGQIKGERLADVVVLAFQAPLSFLNAYGFRQGVLELIEDRPRKPALVVLEASSIIAIDFTAATVVSEVMDACRNAGIIFAVARLESVRAQEAFLRFGLLDRLGPDRVFHSVDEAIRALGPVRSSTRPSI